MADLADFATGLESGLASFLRQQQREREEERRQAAERRREERFDTQQDRAARQRVLDEARAAERGITLPGVEQTREAGLRPEGGFPDIREGATLDRRSIEAEGPLPNLSGERGFLEGRGRGDQRPELGGGSPGGGGPEAAGSADATGLRQAFSEELQAAASAPPGAEPDLLPGELDPETGEFTLEAKFRPEGGLDRGPDVGPLIRGETPMEPVGREFRLSGGQTFRPDQDQIRERELAAEALQDEIRRIQRARPDLSREEAELLARDQEDVLTFGRDEGRDDTFNIRGREFDTLEGAVRADRAFDRGGGGEEDRPLHAQFGFENQAEFRRWEDRVDALGDIYGNTQGDPLLQRALENRARGLSESEVIQKATEAARQQGMDEASIRAIESDLRSFFQQRNRRQIEAMASGNLGDLPNLGTGFDLDFGGTGRQGPTGSSGGGGGRRPLGPVGGGR